MALNLIATCAGGSGLAGLKGLKNGDKNAVSGAVLTGTSNAAANQHPKALTARITAPANGTIIALDPDIPPNRQRLHFSAETAFNGQKLVWKISNRNEKNSISIKPFAQGATAQWLPWPGKHWVELQDAQGQVLDVVLLEVRGAGVVAAGAAAVRR